MNPVDGRLTSLSLNYSLNTVPFLTLLTIIIYFFELKFFNFQWYALSEDVLEILLKQIIL